MYAFRIEKETISDSFVAVREDSADFHQISGKDVYDAAPFDVRYEIRIPILLIK